MPAPEIAVAYVSVVPEVAGFARELRNQIVGPAGDAGSRAGTDASNGLRDKLKAGAAIAAVAAGAALVKGLTDAIDQSNIQSKLQAQLGASGKDAGRYGKIAGKLYASGVTDSFQTGADTIRAIVNAGLVPPGATNKQLQSIATKMADVSSVFGTDMNMQTQAVSAMLKNNLAPNASAALDVISVGMQKLGPNAEDLLDTFQEYSVQLKKLGIDSETALGLFRQGIQGGARDTDIVADALKEFSILSIDTSKTSRDAYKSLGLDAAQMEAQIGKGGKSASAGLQTVLDKLRGMSDPVKREAAAVGLFGTQAEDLGKALFELDPAKATGAMGKVGGAADGLGKTIRTGPMHELTVFTRTLRQGLVDVLVQHVIPAIGNMIDIARDVAGAMRSAWNWVKEYGPLFIPLAIAVGGLTLALNANAIATWLMIGAMNAARIAIAIGTAVTGGFAAVMGTLNAIMALNPFVLVAIALAALVAGIVIAYKRSETFRAIVQAAWAGIQTAAMYAWNNVLKPIFNALAAIVMWLYETIFKPIFSLLVKVFNIWWAAVKVYISAVVSIITILAGIVRWLYGAVMKPIFRLIGAVLSFWWGVAKKVFGAVMDIVRAMGSVVKWLWDKAIRPVFNWISDKAKWLWATGIKPSFDAIKKGVSLVGDAFGKAKDMIGKAWGKLQGIVKKPISFVINTVFNRGIVGVWNKVAKAFGATKLSEFHPKGFASGGILPGYTPGRDVHMAALSGGEAIMRPEWTRAMGSGYVNHMNAAARNGGVGGVKRAVAGGAPAFADGGIFGWVKDAGAGAWDKVKEGASWLKDGIKASALAGMNRIVKPLIDKIGGNAGLYSDAVKGIPRKMMSSILDFGGQADKRMAEAGVGGAGTKSALRWAHTQHGKRYQWGGNGNPSWDCSGFTSAIESVIRGQKPHRRWSTHAFAGGNAPAGWVRGMKAPYMVGITHSGVGHTAGTLNGVNVESRGGDGVVVGNRARGANSSLFSSVYGFSPSRKYDAGGWLQPGATAAVNGTGRPEPILTAQQWANVSTLASQATGGLQPGDRLVLSTEGGAAFEAYVDRRAGDRIESELVGPAGLGRNL